MLYYPILCGYCGPNAKKKKRKPNPKNKKKYKTHTGTTNCHAICLYVHERSLQCEPQTCTHFFLLFFMNPVQAVFACFRRTNRLRSVTAATARSRTA